jgi:hypothetical protein
MLKAQQNKPLQPMFYGDSVRRGFAFSKKPHVIWVQNKCLIYYSVQGNTHKSGTVQGLGIATAKSAHLSNWQRLGDITT